MQKTEKNAKNQLTSWGENGRERETLGRNGRLCHLLPQLCQQPRTSLRPFLQVDSDTESTGPGVSWCPPSGGRNQANRS